MVLLSFGIKAWRQTKRVILTRVERIQYRPFNMNNIQKRIDGKIVGYKPLVQKNGKSGVRKLYSDNSISIINVRLFGRFRFQWKTTSCNFNLFDTLKYQPQKFHQQDILEDISEHNRTYSSSIVMTIFEFVE